MLTRFGAVFLLVNLYTRYYEYFWNSQYKFLFFVIAGLTLALAGILTERTRLRQKTII